jgi:Condensation domain
MGWLCWSRWMGWPWWGSAVADGVLPLAAEQRLLLARAAMQRAPVYTISYGYRVTGDLDVGRLAAATRRLAAQVPLLCSVFEGSRVLPTGMRVLPEQEVFVDHGTVEDPEAFLGGLAGRRVRLTRDPLFQVGVARHGTDHVVATMWHHAIVDAWSVGLCTRWLGELYADTGGPPEGAGRWPDFVAQEAAELAAAEDPGRFWLDQHRDATFAALVPAVAESPSGQADAVTTEVAGAGFPQRCRAVGGTPGAVLLAAATLAAGDAAGPVALPTMLVNREPPFEDTVGLFMRTALLRGEPLGPPPRVPAGISGASAAAGPVSVSGSALPGTSTSSGSATVSTVRRGVLRQLGRCWRHRHESLLLLAERSPAAAAQLAAGPLPFFAQVLDVPRRELALAGCEAELVFHGFERTTRFGVELHLRPRDGGAVEGAFVYDVARYRRADVVAAAARYRAWVDVLTDPAAGDQPVDRVGSAVPG